MKKITVYILTYLLLLSIGPVYAEKVKEVKSSDQLVLENGAIIRLLGIDTPDFYRLPPHQFYAQEAWQFTLRQARKKEVRLEYDHQRHDESGYVFAYVYLPDGRMLNTELIKKGYAKVKDEGFPFKFEKEFKAHEREAQEKNLGLWQNKQYIWDGKKFVKRENLQVPQATENTE